jgi:ribosomal 50S subunit-recycling heat shock protein
MRLDLFLKSSRLCARRSLAQKFCEANLVKVNTSVAKSSKEIKPGDEIEIKRGNRLTKIRVTEVPVKKQVSRAESTNLYEIVSEEILEDTLF